MYIPPSFKIVQVKDWYLRVDLTIITAKNVLLGFNTAEGVYGACTDATMSNCATFFYSEFQIGFLLFTLTIGKEKLIHKYDATKDIEVQQDIPDGTGSGDDPEGDEGGHS